LADWKTVLVKSGGVIAVVGSPGIGRYLDIFSSVDQTRFLRARKLLPRKIKREEEEEEEHSEHSSIGTLGE
jgi:hypothetical protein